jgi:hypothetical protein
MSLRVQHRDGSIERRVLTGMIVNANVLGPVSAKWEKGMMSSPWSNIVGQWCVDYYREYGDAPGKMIESLYESWAHDNDDQDTVKIVNKFLSELSKEYSRLKEETNADYVVDLASEHLNRTRARAVLERAEGHLLAGEVDKVYELFGKSGRVEVGKGSGVNVFQDTEAIKQTFAARGLPLVTYPGALGNFYGDALERDGFVALMGPEKVGKTWWLMDIAWRGMLQGRRVAFFEVGDLSQNQIMRRWMVRAAGRPWKPGIVRRPINITHNPDETFSVVDHEEKEFKEPLDYEYALAKCQKLSRHMNNEPLLKLSVHPNDSISVYGIESELDQWERMYNWSPDIIIVDYADILAPPTKAAETRDQINATWKRLRSLSQARHCLVVTATQAKATSYNAELLDRSDFSEDKRKFAHVTAMIGLNVTEVEKEMMVTRLNYLVLREDEFVVTKCVHAAGSLALANPAVLSTF